jgi:hypothetical protein
LDILAQAQTSECRCGLTFTCAKLIQYVDSQNKNKKPIIIDPELQKELDSCIPSLAKEKMKLNENDYFASNERVELSHVMSWMLECTEYGLLSTSGMEVGYYDRLEDKYSSYLRQDFPESNGKKKTQTIP